MNADSVALHDVRLRRSSRVTFLAASFGLGLAVGLAVSIVSTLNSSTRPGQSSGVAIGEAGTPAYSTVSDYVAAVTGLQTAERRHDARMAARYRDQLSLLRTPAMMGAIHAQAGQILANLATARARGDAQALARYRQQLGTLCGPVDTSNRLEFCRWTQP